MKLLYKWLNAAILLVACTTASAANPATCNFTDVQAAVGAAVPGDTITIPAGSCDWGANQLTVPGGITLKGSGMEATVLRRTAPVPTETSTYLVRFDCYNGQPAKFSDMTLVGANLPTSQDRGLGIIGGSVDFVVANAKFTKFVFAGIEVKGKIRQRGVIHSCQFIDNYNSTVRNLGYGVAVFGDGTWPSLELGSANAVFVENNYMAGNRHHIASNNGARYVFRYNTCVGNDLTKHYPQVDAHGLSSWPRGTRSWEIYHNDFSANTSPWSKNLAAIGIRGGDGVIFDNTYTSSIAHPVLLILEGGSCGTYPVKDQTREANITNSGRVTSQCEQSIKLNRDYFLTGKAGYQPYPYPHPLRSN